MSAFQSPFQEVIHLSRYARKHKKTGRRETWDQTIGRYLGFFEHHLDKNFGYKAPPAIASSIAAHLSSLGALPSMRALMAAGPMLEAEHLTGYNCSYVPIDHPRAFDEILYLLMCTCGVGFSVERQFVAQLPLIPRRFRESGHIVVPDTRAGWSHSYRSLIDHLYKGLIPTWDISQVRGKGSPLKTTGGTASGPDPLVQLFKFTITIFQQAAGRRLTSLECHDIVCHIGDIIMVGDVRQAALISLSNPSDLRMRGAKSGNWMAGTPWRVLANNSAAYTDTPTPGAFMTEWLALYESKSGERGIFNRAAAIEKCQEISRPSLWANGDEIEFGTNPCGEIILRPNQLCNLSEAVCRADDTEASLEAKVTAATVLGTWQSTLTKFKHVRPKWRENCEDERLLGVSLTGIMDCPLINSVSKASAEFLRHLRHRVQQINATLASELGISPSMARTTVKPSGTASLLVNSSSGIHARHAQFYIRRINMNRNNPMTKFMVAVGLPHEPNYYKPNEIATFEFPMRAPEGAIVEGERGAIETLEHWAMVRRNWCDHNPSTTITVAEEEWPRVGGWVYDHFNELGGVSFLPDTDMSVYKQLPLEAVTESQYRNLDAAMPAAIDWSELHDFERGRVVEAPRQEFACVAGACERV